MSDSVCFWDKSKVSVFSVKLGNAVIGVNCKLSAGSKNKPPPCEERTDLPPCEEIIYDSLTLASSCVSISTGKESSESEI